MHLGFSHHERIGLVFSACVLFFPLLLILQSTIWLLSLSSRYYHLNDPKHSQRYVNQTHHFQCVLQTQSFPENSPRESPETLSHTIHQVTQA